MMANQSPTYYDAAGSEDTLSYQTPCSSGQTPTAACPPHGKNFAPRSGSWNGGFGHEYASVDDSDDNRFGDDRLRSSSDTSSGSHRMDPRQQTLTPSDLEAVRVSNYQDRSRSTHSHHGGNSSAGSALLSVGGGRVNESRSASISPQQFAMPRTVSPAQRVFTETHANDARPAMHPNDFHGDGFRSHKPVGTVDEVTKSHHRGFSVDVSPAKNEPAAVAFDTDVSFDAYLASWGHPEDARQSVPTLHKFDSPAVPTSVDEKRSVQVKQPARDPVVVDAPSRSHCRRQEEVGVANRGCSTPIPAGPSHTAPGGTVVMSGAKPKSEGVATPPPPSSGHHSSSCTPCSSAISTARAGDRVVSAAMEARSVTSAEMAALLKLTPLAYRTPDKRRMHSKGATDSTSSSSPADLGGVNHQAQAYRTPAGRSMSRSPYRPAATCLECERKAESLEIAMQERDQAKNALRVMQLKLDDTARQATRNAELAERAEAKAAAMADEAAALRNELEQLKTAKIAMRKNRVVVGGNGIERQRSSSEFSDGMLSYQHGMEDSPVVSRGHSAASMTDAAGTPPPLPPGSKSAVASTATNERELGPISDRQHERPTPRTGHTFRSTPRGLATNQDRNAASKDEGFSASTAKAQSGSSSSRGWSAVRQKVASNTPTGQKDVSDIECTFNIFLQQQLSNAGGSRRGIR